MKSMFQCIYNSSNFWDEKSHSLVYLINVEFYNDIHIYKYTKYELNKQCKNYSYFLKIKKGKYFVTAHAIINCEVIFL